MAKKRKKYHTTRRRHRRVSGIGHGLNNDLMEAAGLVAAAVIGPALQKSITMIPLKLVSGAEAAVGWKMKSSAHPFWRGAGWGFFGTGIIGLTHEMGLIRGVEDFVSGMMDEGQGYIEDPQYMHGISNNNTMSGMSNGNTMSGNPEYTSDTVRYMM
jgi:hypothetical protein